MNTSQLNKMTSKLIFCRHLQDPKVKGILVNVFGGIVDCAIIANGVVKAYKALDMKLPIVCRLAGTNVDNAKKVIEDSGLPIQVLSIAHKI